MNNFIDVSRRQDIENYLDKMLGDNDRKIAKKRISLVQKAKAKVVKSACDKGR